MPEGMEEVYKFENDAILKILFVDKKQELYFEIEQKVIEINFKTVYGSNTEIYYTEIVTINNEFVKVAVYEDRIEFHFIHGNYLINGHTNLIKNELYKIMENIKL